METELDGFYGLFMPVLNHRLLDAKVEFLAIFKPSDFEYGGPLFEFPNILSLMHICQRGRKKFICPNVCNPKIDLLRNETHKKFLKELHSNVISKVNFTPNNFALRNRNLTFFELVAKYSVHFLTGALKKSARKISGRNAPPPPSWLSRQKDQRIFPPLEHFQNSLLFSVHKKIPPSLRSFHFDYLSRVTPSLTKLVQYKNNDIMSSKCPRYECQLSDLTADTEHIVYDCVFSLSILYFIDYAYKHDAISYKLDELYYLFPFIQKNNYNLSLELFVLFTQIKITAFQVATEERFVNWNHNHFYVRLLSILKISSEICEMYGIPIRILYPLLEYAEKAAIGLLHSYIYDYALIHGIYVDRT